MSKALLEFREDMMLTVLLSIKKKYHTEILEILYHYFHLKDSLKNVNETILYFFFVVSALEAK